MLSATNIETVPAQTNIAPLLPVYTAPIRLTFAKGLRSDMSKLKVAKAVVILLATPFIGLVFLVTLPLVGFVCCAWHAFNHIAERSDRYAEFRSPKNAPSRSWIASGLSRIA